MDEIYVFDIECDGLKPTKIWCLSYKDNKGIHTLTDYEDMKKFLLNAKYLCGHNISRFDIPVLEKLLDIKITAMIIDSLALSWYLFPERGGNKHNLDSWGVTFGVPKPKIDNWDELPLEDYIHRCEEDIKINSRLWLTEWNKLLAIYKDQDLLFRFLRYIEFKMKCTRLQEESGWLLNIEFIKQSIEELEKEQQEKFQKLKEVMPRVPIKVKKQQPKKPLKADGTPSKIGQAWLDLLAKEKLPKNTQEVELVQEYEEPNPSSNDQKKNWLFSLGWVPETYDYKKDENGKERKIPKINQDFGKGICESIKKLYDKEPNLEYLDGLSILNHRIPILRGFLKMQEDGYVKATVNGLTNTLRFQHASPCVNLPKAEKPYGKNIRGALIAPNGFELCGADMSGLEDVLKRHFIFPLDPDYVRSMDAKDFDSHLDIAVLSDMMKDVEAELYKHLDKKEDKTPAEKKEYSRLKSIRSIAKNVNYSGQYGAGPAKMSLTGGFDIETAKKLHKVYWDRNWAIKEVAKQQKVIYVKEEKYLVNPVSGYCYFLRQEKDRFSTLVQGTAAYTFDVWVRFVLEQREQLTAQFHDELVLCIRKGNREECTKMLRQTINQTNEFLKLNRELDIGIQYGDNYAQIH